MAGQVSLSADATYANQESADVRRARVNIARHRAGAQSRDRADVRRRSWLVGFLPLLASDPGPPRPARNPPHCVPPGVRTRHSVLPAVADFLGLLPAGWFRKVCVPTAQPGLW